MKYLREILLEEHDRLPTIFLDMDGTIVDWMDGANKALADSKMPDWYDPYWKKTYGNKKDDLAKWGYLNSTPNFWENLKWLDNAMAMWKFVKVYKPEILSACGDGAKNCKQGKLKWIRSNIKNNEISAIHLVKRVEKKKFATDAKGNPNILIDDYIKNCKEWESAGGIAIRFTTSSDVISKLKKIGFR